MAYGILFISVISVIVAFVAYDFKETAIVCDERYISKIGGCNKDGICGVMYSDMTYGREYYPVVGKVVKHCKSK